MLQLVHVKHPDSKTDRPGIVSRRHYDAHLADKGWQIVSQTTGEPVPSAEEIGKLSGPKVTDLLAAEGVSVADDAKVSDKQSALLVHYGYEQPAPTDAGEPAGGGVTPA